MAMRSEPNAAVPVWKYIAEKMVSKKALFPMSF